MLGLASLIAPLTVEEFLGNFWGRRAVYIPGTEGKFSGLFGWDDVNAYLNNARENQPGFRLVHEKSPLPAQALDKLDEWLGKGATLAINSVNQIDEVMKRFNYALGADLNTVINTNCYISCPAKQGFDNHFDEHDVFVLQTEGRKAWKVFQPTLTYPLHAQQLASKGAPPDVDPYIECVLSPGDVLFIPRGHWHYAIAETPSVHLTIGPASRAGVEFLVWLSRQLMHSQEFFRKDFPVAGAAAFGGPMPAETLDAHLADFRRHVIDLMQSDTLSEALVSWIMESNPAKRTRQLPQAWLFGTRLSEDTLLEIPAVQKTVVRYDVDTGSAAIHVRGQLLQLAGMPEALMGPLFGRTGVPFTGRLLLEACPDFNWEQLRELLLQLYANGIIELSEDDTTVVA